MRLQPSDPDIATIFARIISGDLDLQPEFQRGEVWPTAKKKKLIDSILRNWHVPPIHIIENSKTATQEVLDGQQRLVSIRDFMLGEFTIDGHIAPIDDAITQLDGLTFEELPPQWKRRFNQFSIRLFRITDYEPEEPSELFFRLNQPVSLTSAEQRNAFFGPIRNQVRDLVDYLTDRWKEGAIRGFSNSRMALDDVIAKTCFCFERHSIRDKVSANDLADRYRNKAPFSTDVVDKCKQSIDTLCKSSELLSAGMKFNKATLFSALWFIASVQHVCPRSDNNYLIAETFERLERERHPHQEGPEYYSVFPNNLISRFALRRFHEFYTDRSSSRVSDVVSVVGRDVVLWVYFSIATTKANAWSPSLLNKTVPLQEELPLGSSSRISPEDTVESLLEGHNWGELQ